MRRVLVFDCPSGQLGGLAERLQDAGYLTETATNWVDLSEQVVQFAPQAVLVDLDARRPMYAQSSRVHPGFPFVKFPPLIGVTAHIETVRLSLAALITKPVVIDEVLATLTRVIEAQEANSGSSGAAAS